MKTSFIFTPAACACANRFFPGLVVGLLLNLMLSFSAAAQSSTINDLSISNTASSVRPTPGTSVTIFLTVVNNGNIFGLPDATNNIDPEITFGSAAASDPPPPNLVLPPRSSYNASTKRLTVPPFSLSPGQSTTMQISFTMPSYTVFVSWAAASRTNDDPDRSNNEGNNLVITPVPLPVVLARFEAVAEKSDAQLSWTTATELGNDRFEVERSLDGRAFVRIGTVRGQGTSTRARDYRFTDVGAARRGAALAYYRLRQVDTDGTEAVSPVRVVTFTGFPQARVGLYPNPAPGQTALDLRQLPAGTYQVRVLDLTGRQVGTYTLEGASEQPLGVQHLLPGPYVVHVVGQGVRLTLPLVRN